MDWQAEYRRKLRTPEQAVAPIAADAQVVLGVALSHPPALLEALAARLRAGDLRELAVLYTYALAPLASTLLAPELAAAVRPKTTFLTAADRAWEAASGGAVLEYLPGYLHQIPRLLEERIDVDTFLAVSSPMDGDGFLGLGPCIAYAAAAARKARRVVVEVNERCPRIPGDAALHISEVDAVVEHTEPLFAVPRRPSRPADEKIGRAIADEIPDGATLQLGVGALPDALTTCLGGHRDLGIHTELFTPGMQGLIEQGVVTGRRKTLLPQRHVFTLALGDARLYEFLDGNAALEGRPCSFTNDPVVIAENDRMISVNSILEVDLYGQVNAEFLDGHEFSGVGGQHDFVSGAYRSKGGKSFLAFHATAHEGRISRVVPQLTNVVTDPRMDVQYLVTEHGLVNLKGRTTRERAELIVSIADPRFRDELLREAKQRRLL